MDDLPSISFHFLSNVTITLPKENYFYAVSPPKNSTVVKCLLFQAMDDGDYGPAGVFGNFQQHNLEVVYDLEKQRIGFNPWTVLLMQFPRNFVVSMLKRDYFI